MEKQISCFFLAVLIFSGIFCMIYFIFMNLIARHYWWAYCINVILPQSSSILFNPFYRILTSRILMSDIMSTLLWLKYWYISLFLYCRRFNLRGARHVIFYSLPEYAHFYPEIVNGLGDTDGGGLGSDISCLVLFTQYEKMALERMVGAKRCAHILSSAKTTFMFC